MNKSISAVIPVYNSEKTIKEVVHRTLSTISKLSRDTEIILIDDGSTDNSWKELESLSKNNSVICIKLLKNYGQHCANMCGFNNSTKDLVVTLDDDLQNPPEEITKLYSALSADVDIVYGEYEEKKHNILRKVGSFIVNKLNKKIFNVRNDVSLSNFRLIRRRVIDNLVLEDSEKPYIPGLLLKYAGNIKCVKVQHSERSLGRSNYNIRKLMSLLADLLFQHSRLPLRIVSIFGFLVSLLAFILGSFFIYNAVQSEIEVPGWASLAVLISFFSGVIIFLMSIIGEYFVRLLKQSPSSYVISERLGK